jgi:hypothetical protein
MLDPNWIQTNRPWRPEAQPPPLLQDGSFCLLELLALRLLVPPR